MPSSPDDDAFFAKVFSRACEAEPAQGDVDAVIARLGSPSPGRRSRGRSRLAKIAAGMAITGTLVAVSPVGAAVADLGGTFAGYFAGDDSGKELGSASIDESQAPPWLDKQEGERLLASDGGFQLYIGRQDDGRITFSLDQGLTITDTVSGWEKQFEGASIIPFGLVAAPIGEKLTTVPVYGVAASGVTTVQVRYADGSAVDTAADTGGFVALVDPSRDPVELVAVDGTGAEGETVDLTQFEFPE